MGSAASTSRKKQKAETVEKVPQLPSGITSHKEHKTSLGEETQKSPLQAQNKRSVNNEGGSDHYIDPDLILDDEGGQLELETDYDDEEREETGDSEDRKLLEQNRENWSILKHSLEMDNEDLLLNMLYFSDDGAASMEDSASMGKVLDGAMTETFALHSENNTPYKLKPATKEDMEELKAETMDAKISDSLKMGHDEGSKSVSHGDSFDSGPESKGTGVECVVCKEELEIGDKIMRMPHCMHAFHEECLSKWLRHQDWCPICRASISGKLIDGDSNSNDLSLKKPAAGEEVTTTTISTSASIMGTR